MPIPTRSDRANLVPADRTFTRMVAQPSAPALDPLHCRA
jgi:hypothetical protein